ALPRGRTGLGGLDEAVVVAVEPVKLIERPEELPARDVAVAVAVHAAEPSRARGVPGRRGGFVGSSGRADGVAGHPRQPAAGDDELDVIGDLIGIDATVTVAVPGRDALDGPHDLAGAEPTVAVGVEDAEDRPAVVPDRGDEPAPRRVELLGDEVVQLVVV